MAVHPTALIEPGAQIHASAEVGPYCIVGARVRVGAGSRLHSHVVLQGRTTLGTGNVVHPFAVLGGMPQDLKYCGEEAQLHIGDDNTFREGVTVNIGTQAGGMCTRIGSQCLLMAYAHVAHDCSLGDGVILANGVALAGHVSIDARATVGGLAAVHQHCRIGRLAFVGGGTMVAQDVLPFCIAQGDRATVAGLNIVGLRRQGFVHTQVAQLRHALQTLFTGDHTRAQALTLLEARADEGCAEVAELVRFVRAAQRGICAARPTAFAQPTPTARREAVQRRNQAGAQQANV